MTMARVFVLGDGMYLCGVCMYGKLFFFEGGSLKIKAYAPDPSLPVVVQNDNGAVDKQVVRADHTWGAWLYGLHGAPQS
jgi:hypothetical protein